MRKIGITADCVCDLPEGYLRANGVELIYFYITTDTGRFKDGYEITSGNILEYQQGGGVKAETRGPEPGEYQAFFERCLERYDELVHIGISEHIGHAHESAMAALELMGEAGRRVTVVDSQHLSTGMGHQVMRAVEMRDGGSSAEEIVRELIRLRDKVSTTFITWSADALCQNNQVGPKVARLCTFFAAHPVLTVKKGRISLKMFRIGRYERSIMRYVRSELKRSGGIDNKRLFITHAGCTLRLIAQIKAEAERLCPFQEIVVTRASATVSSNCGPGTVGVIFIQK